MLVAISATSALASERLLDVSHDGTRALVARYGPKNKKFLDYVDTATGNRIASAPFSYGGVVNGRLSAPGVADVIGHNGRLRSLQWDVSKATVRELAGDTPEINADREFEKVRRCELGGFRTIKSAASRDGKFVVSVIDQPVNGKDGEPTDTAHVTIASARDCRITQSFAIKFPEVPREKAPLLAPKNRYWANERMAAGGWGELVAISPDSAVLAVAYSILTDGIYSNVLAKIAFFSMADGKRIDAFQVAILRDNLFTHLFPVPNADPINTGPWSGALRFSPDGKWLYGSTSKFHRIKVPE